MTKQELFDEHLASMPEQLIEAYLTDPEVHAWVYTKVTLLAHYQDRLSPPEDALSGDSGPAQ